MTVWGLWDGGAGYEPGGTESVERFDSLAEAREVFEGRYRDGHWRDYGTGLTPCVDQESTHLLLFKDNPDFADSWDLIPDWILKFGPRGGVVRGAC